MQLPPIDHPYKFIPAYKSLRYCHWERPLLSILLRKRFRIERFGYVGGEHLLRTIEARKGTLLASTHSRNADPPTVGMMSLHLNHFFYYAASFHLFLKSRLERWQMNRLGAFSVLREGTDLDAIRQSVDILSNADRPLVIFPEGTFYRRNERIGPLQDGVAFIARQAMKKKQAPIVIHPVISKYWFLEDPREAIEKRLACMESKLLWGRQSGSPAERILRLTHVVLAVKEIEYLGDSRADDMGERMQSLAEVLLDRLESKHRIQKKAQSLMERVRILRQFCYKLIMKQPAGDLREDLREDLHKIAVAQQLFAHSPDYLIERPSLDRVAEAVQRLEEDLWDTETPIAPMGAVIGIGPAIEVEEFPAPKRGDGATDPLMVELAQRMRILLKEVMDAGPPKEWNAPPSWQADPMVSESDRFAQVSNNGKGKEPSARTPDAASEQD